MVAIYVFHVSFLISIKCITQKIIDAPSSVSSPDIQKVYPKVCLEEQFSVVFLSDC